MAEVTLTMGDRGRTVPVSLGDRVVLRLPENAATGVRWQVPLSDALEVIADTNLPGGAGIGAAGERMLTVKPTAAGRISLRLARHQAWESAETADALFAVELDVR